jgi:hypothetical protein
MQVVKKEAKQFLISKGVPISIADPASESAELVRPSFLGNA